MSATIKFVITFDSDWAVGTGRGQHDAVDSLVRRDADGLPFVPGKSLRGVLRDAALDVVIALDEAADGPWHKWYLALFGASGVHGLPASSGCLVVPSAHLEAAIRGVLTADTDGVEKLRKHVVMTRGSTAIDSDSGTAAQDTLRLVERARVGSQLHGTFVIDGVSDAQWACDAWWPARFLLLAAARLVVRLGGTRRRGVGECTVKLSEAASEWQTLLGLAQSWDGSADALPKVPASPKATDAVVPENGQKDGDGAPANTAWRVLRYDLTTDDPVIASAGAFGNLEKSERYLPGATLLAVLDRLHGGALSEAVARGDVVVTDATPSAPGGERGLPIPACLRQAKRPEHRHGVVVNQILDELRDAEGNWLQTMRLGDPHILLHSRDAIAPRETPLVTTMHNNVDRATQRPGLNGIYALQAIAPRTTLSFEVAVRDEKLYETLSGVTWETTAVRVGASKFAEYGRSTLTKPRKVQLPAVSDGGSVQRLTVWLTSDALPKAGSTVAAFVADLSEALGVTLTLASDSDYSSVFGSFVRREGWQGRWGLPKPSLVALERGSVLVLDVDGELTAGRVRDVELEGVGRRRAEGYGRVLLNHPLLDMKRPTVVKVEPSPSEGEFPRLVSEPAWLTAVRKDALRDAIETAAAIWADTHGRRLLEGSSASQNGDLREAAQEVLLRRDHEFDDRVRPLRQWIQSLENKAVRQGGGVQRAVGKALDSAKSGEPGFWDGTQWSGFEVAEAKQLAGGSVDLTRWTSYAVARAIIAACASVSGKHVDGGTKGESW